MIPQLATLRARRPSLDRRAIRQVLVDRAPGEVRRQAVAMRWRARELDRRVARSDDEYLERLVRRAIRRGAS